MSSEPLFINDYRYILKQAFNHSECDLSSFYFKVVRVYSKNNPNLKDRLFETLDECLELSGINPHSLDHKKRIYIQFFDMIHISNPPIRVTLEDIESMDNWAEVEELSNTTDFKELPKFERRKKLVNIVINNHKEHIEKAIEAIYTEEKEDFELNKLSDLYRVLEILGVIEHLEKKATFGVTPMQIASVLATDPTQRKSLATYIRKKKTSDTSKDNCMSSNYSDRLNKLKKALIKQGFDKLD